MMMSSFKVTIEYKNKNLETIVEKEYSFVDYAELLSTDLKHVLAFVEESFVYFTGKQKQDWSPDVLERFNKIRHKILDEANAIKRLPDNLSYNGIKASSMSMGELLARKSK